MKSRFVRTTARAAAALSLACLLAPVTLADPPERDRDSRGGERKGSERGDRERGGPERGDRERGGPERGDRERGGPEGGGPEGGGPERGGPRGEGLMRGGPGGFDPVRMMRAFPVIAALDADQDGVISASEIKNASAALKKLDKNDDGEIDLAEMRPAFPGAGGPPPRDGERRGDGPRDSDRRPGGPRDGDRPRGPGDSEAGDRSPMRGDGAAMAKRLMQFDADGDGELTKEELPERAQGFFERIDRDDSGSISKQELEAMSKWRDNNRPDREGEGRPRSERKNSGDEI